MQSKKWTNCWKILVKGIVLIIYMLYTLYLDFNVECILFFNQKNHLKKCIESERVICRKWIFLYVILCVQWEMSLKPKLSLYRISMCWMLNAFKRCEEMKNLVKSLNWLPLFCCKVFEVPKAREKKDIRSKGLMVI